MVVFSKFRVRYIQCISLQIIINSITLLYFFVYGVQYVKYIAELELCCERGRCGSDKYDSFLAFNIVSILQFIIINVSCKYVC